MPATVRGMRRLGGWTTAALLVAATLAGCTATVSGAADERPDATQGAPDLASLGHGSLEGQDVVLWFWAGY